MAAIGERSKTISCDGICHRKFHINCANIDTTLFSYFASVSGLSWKCGDCKVKCFSIDQVGLTDFLDRKHSEMLLNPQKQLRF
jgi:hypothetical protein